MKDNEYYQRQRVMNGCQIRGFRKGYRGVLRGLEGRGRGIQGEGERGYRGECVEKIGGEGIRVERMRWGREEKKG